MNTLIDYREALEQFMKEWLENQLIFTDKSASHHETCAGENVQEHSHGKNEQRFV